MYSKNDSLNVCEVSVLYQLANILVSSIPDSSEHKCSSNSVLSVFMHLTRA